MSLRRRESPEDRAVRRAAERAAGLRTLITGNELLERQVNYGGSTTEPIPKNPADRMQAFRALAAGEACVFQVAEVCRRDPSYTVLCHTNTQADEKGMGYKAHDSAGLFGCDRCHEVLDRRLLPPITLEEILRGARERMTIRLRFIANAINERAWRIRAAKWALQQLEARKP